MSLSRSQPQQPVSWGSGAQSLPTSSRGISRSLLCNYTKHTGEASKFPRKPPAILSRPSKDFAPGHSGRRRRSCGCESPPRRRDFNGGSSGAPSGRTGTRQQLEAEALGSLLGGLPAELRQADRARGQPATRDDDDVHLQRPALRSGRLRVRSGRSIFAGRAVVGTGSER